MGPSAEISSKPPTQKKGLKFQDCFYQNFTKIWHFKMVLNMENRSQFPQMRSVRNMIRTYSQTNKDVGVIKQGLT